MQRIGCVVDLHVLGSVFLNELKKIWSVILKLHGPSMLPDEAKSVVSL